MIAGQCNEHPRADRSPRHSDFAAERLHPFWTQTVPVLPDASQNLTRAQPLVSAAGPSAAEGPLGTASPALSSWLTRLVASVIGSYTGAAVSLDSPMQPPRIAETNSDNTARSTGLIDLISYLRSANQRAHGEEIAAPGDVTVYFLDDEDLSGFSDSMTGGVIDTAASVDASGCGDATGAALDRR